MNADTMIKSFKSYSLLLSIKSIIIKAERSFLFVQKLSIETSFIFLRILKLSEE